MRKRTKKRTTKYGIVFNKDEVIRMMEIMQVNMDQIKSLLITVDQLNNDLFHEKWKFRYVARRLKQVAMETDQPDIAVTEEELDEQIRKKTN